MAIFNSYVSLPEGNWSDPVWSTSNEALIKAMDIFEAAGMRITLEEKEWHGFLDHGGPWPDEKNQEIWEFNATEMEIKPLI